MSDNTVIIDYGLGNIKSIKKILDKWELPVTVSKDYDIISNASKLILPGIGHFKEGMKNLKDNNLIDVLNQKVLKDKTPILGICLGMQLMTNFSDEGNCEGLRWVDAETRKFDVKLIRPLKVPHIGWNSIEIKKRTKLLRNIELNNLFYFVHSYFVCCNTEDDILTTSKYGFDFVSSFEKDNIIGVQFHPERSHNAGLNIIKNFILNV